MISFHILNLKRANCDQDEKFFLASNKIDKTKVITIIESTKKDEMLIHIFVLKFNILDNVSQVSLILLVQRAIQDAQIYLMHEDRIHL